MRTKLLILLIIAVIMGCEKDKEEGPAYVGTWEYNEEDETISTDPFLIVLSQKMVLTLSKDKWQMIRRVKVTPGFSDFEDVMGFKGTMTFDGENVEIVFQEVGYREIDYQTFTFIDDEVVWYSAENDPNMFGSLFYDEFEMEHTTISGKMIVEGNTLTMKMDEDLNGQYDSEEITVFTRI
ncbi:MAG: hypothetical protein JW723_14110 [Bacteroidales bacterium]|nr:hypothetical protein [Bacteroidales bacterium]